MPAHHGRRSNVPRDRPVRGTWAPLGGATEGGIVEHGQIFFDRPPGCFCWQPFLASMPFCRFASALIKLASTAKASPPTSPSRMQRRRTVSNTRRSRSLSRNRPCRFFEKVE